MTRLEWAVIIALLLIASIVTFSHLDGTMMGKFLAGEPLPELKRQGATADSQLFYAVPLVALLLWWASRMFPARREFLRTGALVLLGVAVVYALYLLVD
jgi:hypothetical protein